VSWEERATADGSWTLWSSAVGEGCHSLAGAWQQARERYARACGLEDWERARGACRLLDVGTGLALNLAAALAALEGRGARLEAHTHELDPNVIARGLALYARLGGGPWEPWHARVRAALELALARPGARIDLGHGSGLVLALGDARATLGTDERPDFDAVFLDPFSPRRAPELWQAPFLARVARRMAPRAWLSTYSAAFGVRLALARAGLHVGRGPRVGRKGEGTLASPDLAPPALAPRLARRLERRVREARGAPVFSPDAARDQQPAFD
jgi:tRNA U34 5-methylaminomethyl-2-thiouridine-forming methyltransferase MnmC